MTKVKFLVLSLLITAVTMNAQVKNNFINEPQADFENRMQWFTDAGYGMFIHFGLYSQLGGVWKGDSIDGYSEWIQSKADIASQEYAMLTHTFNPVDFDAEFIVKTAKAAGMKYLVITTKHHEGFCLWDSKYTNFDVASTPFKRDILAELSASCKKHGIRFGTYYSIIDWHHPSQERNIDGNDGWGWWAEIRMKTGRKQEYITYMKNQIKELIDNYDTDILWFDGDWVHWWNNEVGTDLYNYIRGLKPEIIINNRVAKRSNFTKDFGTPEQVHLDEAVNYEWEACYTINGSWGYKIADTNWKQPQEIYDKLKDINAKGGNLLLNIGPDGNGNIPEESVRVLLEAGGMLNKK